MRATAERLVSWGQLPVVTIGASIRYDVKDLDGSSQPTDLAIAGGRPEVVTLRDLIEREGEGACGTLRGPKPRYQETLSKAPGQKGVT